MSNGHLVKDQVFTRYNLKSTLFMNERFHEMFQQNSEQKIIHEFPFTTYIKYSKFRSLFLEHFFEHKPPIFEEYTCLVRASYQ